MHDHKQPLAFPSVQIEPGKSWLASSLNGVDNDDDNDDDKFLI